MSKSRKTCDRKNGWFLRGVLVSHRYVTLNFEPICISLHRITVVSSGIALLGNRCPATSPIALRSCSCNKEPRPAFIGDEGEIETVLVERVDVQLDPHRMPRSVPRTALDPSDFRHLEYGQRIVDMDTFGDFSHYIFSWPHLFAGSSLLRWRGPARHQVLPVQ